MKHTVQFYQNLGSIREYFYAVVFQFYAVPFFFIFGILSIMSGHSKTFLSLKI